MASTHGSHIQVTEMVCTSSSEQQAFFPSAYWPGRSKLSCTKVFARTVLEVLNFTGKLTAALIVLISFAGSNLNFFGNYCDFTRILWDEVGMKSKHRLLGENRSSLLTKISIKSDGKRLLNRSREETVALAWGMASEWHWIRGNVLIFQCTETKVRTQFL